MREGIVDEGSTRGRPAGGFRGAGLLWTVVFYGVITPLAVLSRLLRRDPLALAPGTADSYWRRGSWPAGRALRGQR